MRHSPDALYGIRVDEVADDEGCSAAPDVACPVCCSPRSRSRFRIRSVPHTIRVCDDCGLGWMDPLPTPDQLVSYYPPHYYGADGNKFRGLIEWAVRLVGARRMRFFTAHLRPGAAVLDVGCGRGVLLRELADRGYQVFGTELSEEATRGADPRAHIRCGPTLRDAAFEGGRFDLVIIWHVLEHLLDPRETLAEVHRILKPGGSVIVAVPNFSSWQAAWSKAAWFHLDPPRHVYHFSTPALERLLTSAGFRVTSRHHFSLRQNPFGWVQSALNRSRPDDRNRLYTTLLRHPQSGGPRRGFWERFVQLTAFGLGMPPAIALEIVASMFRRGATVHFVGRKDDAGCTFPSSGEAPPPAASS